MSYRYSRNRPREIVLRHRAPALSAFRAAIGWTLGALLARLAYVAALIAAIVALGAMTK